MYKIFFKLAYFKSRNSTGIRLVREKGRATSYANMPLYTINLMVMPYANMPLHTINLLGLPYENTLQMTLKYRQM